MSTTPTEEQEQRAKWDLLLLDIEMRSEQVRQLKTYEGLRLMFSGATAAAALIGAGAAGASIIIHFFTR